MQVEENNDEDKGMWVMLDDGSIVDADVVMLNIGEKNPPSFTFCFIRLDLTLFQRSHRDQRSPSPLLL
jgi:hypothetical protein